VAVPSWSSAAVSVVSRPGASVLSGLRPSAPEVASLVV
jgi:hypothetical protein